MLSVFTDVVLPVFVIAGLGALVGRWRGIDVSALTTSVMFLFSPALVFDALARTELSWSRGVRIVAVYIMGWTMIVLLSWAWARLRRLDRATRAGFVLAASSPNSGNMGLPVATLAFGDLGLEVAVVAFVVGAVITNSAGIVIASTAGGDRRAAIAAPFRYPYVYAAVLGLLVRELAIDLPVAVTAPVKTLAGAAIPVMLVVLGLQLRTPVTTANAADVVAVTSIRLAVAPLLAWAATSLVGLGGVEQRTMIVVAAMPVAVITTILSTEFRARPDFVTRTVIVSTVASVGTITALVTMVG